VPFGQFELLELLGFVGFVGFVGLLGFVEFIRLLGLVKKMLEGRGALRPAPYSTGLRSPSRRLYPPGWNPLRGGTEPEV
jgi:hypothetical protein